MRYAFVQCAMCMSAVDVPEKLKHTHRSIDIPIKRNKTGEKMEMPRTTVAKAAAAANEKKKNWKTVYS